MNESKIKAVKFTDMSEKPTKITIARKESDLDDNNLKAIFKKVMTSGGYVDMGKIVAEPLKESIIESISERKLNKSRIHIPKLDKPIVGDAIKILSNIKSAEKYTNVNNFKSKLNSYKYFSGSLSHAYDSQAKYKGGVPNLNSVIMKDTGDLIAVWDDVNSIGYIIPPAKLFLNEEKGKENTMNTPEQAYKEMLGKTKLNESKDNFKTWIAKNVSLTGKDKKDVDELEAIKELMKVKGYNNIISFLKKKHVSDDEIERAKDNYITFTIG